MDTELETIEWTTGSREKLLGEDIDWTDGEQEHETRSTVLYSKSELLSLSTEKFMESGGNQMPLMVFAKLLKP